MLVIGIDDMDSHIHPSVLRDGAGSYNDCHPNFDMTQRTLETLGTMTKFKEFFYVVQINYAVVTMYYSEPGLEFEKSNKHWKSFLDRIN